MAKKRRKNGDGFFDKVATELDGLKNNMSSDFMKTRDAKGKSRYWTGWFYRWMFLLWILTFLNIFPFIAVWTLFSAKVTLGPKLLYSIISLIMWLVSAGTMYVTINPKFNGK